VIDNGYLKYDLGYVDMSDVRDGQIDAGEEMLAHARAVASEAGVRASTVMVDEILAMGDIAGEIEQVVEQSHAELVIIGTHGRRGLKRLLLGSVAEGLVRQCVVPVMLVRPAPAAENAAT
jgi:nucleotide-binding universal stress UspA family protein